MTAAIDSISAKLRRIMFTIDFVEQDPETYPLDELAAEEVDGEREAIKARFLDSHTDAIHRAAERIMVLIQSDATLDSILTTHDIGLVLALSNRRKATPAHVRGATATGPIEAPGPYDAHLFRSRCRKQ
jgi:hypothetical protein